MRKVAVMFDWKVPDVFTNEELRVVIKESLERVRYVHQPEDFVMAGIITSLSVNDIGRRP